MRRAVGDIAEVCKGMAWQATTALLLLAIICSVGSGVAWAGSNPILEPSFETVEHWAFSRTTTTYTGQQQTEWATHGNCSYEIAYQAALGLLGGGSAELSQDVDLSDVDKMWFDAQLYAWGLSLGTLVASVFIDDDELWTEDVPLSETQYQDQSIDVSSYNGTHTITFYLENNAVLALGPGGQFRFDNLRVDLVSESIQIKAQDYGTDVGSITFPEGAPGVTVSSPSNGQSETQAFGAAGEAKPVVTLVNTGSATYKLYLEVSTFTDGCVASEYYLVNDKGTACPSADYVNNAVVFDTLTDTGTTIGTGSANAKDLYLKVGLSALAGRSGSSTLTVLGEKP